MGGFFIKYGIYHYDIDWNLKNKDNSRKYNRSLRSVDLQKMQSLIRCI